MYVTNFETRNAPEEQFLNEIAANEANDETENESEDEVEDEAEDEDENEDENKTKYIKIHIKGLTSISYYSHKIDWSNTRVIKTASGFRTFLVLTDDEKVK